MDASFALCTLPLAVGILGTLLAMSVFGRKLPGDRSPEVHELHALLARREQELEQLENSGAAADAQSVTQQADVARLTSQVEQLTAAHDNAEQRAAAAAAQVAALKVDLADAVASRRALEDDLSRRNDDVVALNSRLSEALDELTATRRARK